MGGIGKTALAIETAHKACAAEWFPGGTLFVDLQGYDDNPVTADQAVLALLDALGVRGADLPTTAARQYATYHALLAGRRDRMLLILDNASDPAQYLPLLPGTDRHRVLITSRDRPDSLTGVRLIDLETLPEDDSVALITRALHDADERDDRPAREPDALHELTALCGHLPLALQIAAAMLRRRWSRGIASLVAEIKEAEDPTVALDNGNRGTDQYGRPLVLRPVLETSYRRLPPDQARLLRLLALAPGRETGTDAVAALADLDTEATVRRLEDLAASCLVTPIRADEGSANGVRWRLHDLVRAYAAGVAASCPRLVAEGAAARARVLEFYRLCALDADALLRASEERPVPGRFANRREALAWLDRERAALVGAVQWAREEPYSPAAVRLALHLMGYNLDWRRYCHDWIAISRPACQAAYRLGDQVSAARILNSLGFALRELGHIKQAMAAHTRAGELYQTADDARGEAKAWNNIGLCLLALGEVEEAIEALTHSWIIHHDTEYLTGEATALLNLGNAFSAANRPTEAIDAYIRAIELHHANGDFIDEARSWSNLGITQKETGHFAEAVECYLRAQKIYRDFGNWQGVGETYANLAIAHASVGRHAESRILGFQSAAAYIQAGDTVNADKVRAWAEEQR
nr:tetratricopeptide repeat protein [Streptomyces geranii]